MRNVVALATGLMVLAGCAQEEPRVTVNVYEGSDAAVAAPPVAACVENMTVGCGPTTGVCNTGVHRCLCLTDERPCPPEQLSWTNQCINRVQPGNEVCNDDLDNDCDGALDEENERGGPCCVPDAIELPNDRDDDCDGLVDEDLTCIEGSTRECGNAIAPCRPGLQHCVGGFWGSECVGGRLPADREICDQIDNNCNGSVDEAACACTPGDSRGCGPDPLLGGMCRQGTQRCNDDGTWGTCGGSGLAADRPVYPSPDNDCDNADDDCDGEIDEDAPPGVCPCVTGATRNCGSHRNAGPCHDGTQTCRGGVWDACEGKVDPADSDTCGDRIDNDCDGTVDPGCDCGEGETVSCGESRGACRLGTQTCLPSGHLGPCEGAVDPESELCRPDNVDEDCDGAINEGCLCVSPSAPITCDTGHPGNCGAGAQICGGDGTLGPCVGTADAPTIERLDGHDNDCDGEADEGFDCNAAVTPHRACNVPGASGICRQGEQDCIDSRWTPCLFTGTTSPEVCDGIDSDCDTETDEGVCVCTPNVEEECRTGFCGECADGTMTCRDSGTDFSECIPLFWPWEAFPEICGDGVDNDCDCETDETCLTCFPGARRPCGVDIGLCTPGIEICNSSGEWGTCSDTEPQTETCNNQDDDCDGATDEDAGCECTGAPRTCGIAIGACTIGSLPCVAGRLGTCSGIGPEAETCNGIDDNCNGTIDDNLLNACGDCGQVPAEVCDGEDNNCNGYVDEGQLNRCLTCGIAPLEVCDGVDNDCDGQVDEGLRNRCGDCSPVDPPEACNGLDDNCDTRIDEGCPCGIVGVTRDCGTNEGECSAGTETCTPGGWGPCTGQLPRTESCNTLDDDCDGAVDEDVTNACGGCGPTPPERCNGEDDNCDGRVDEGLLNRCQACGMLPAEVCDGVDNDCDGDIDEGVKNACGGCGNVPNEICNGEDDDCNGQTDEGCSCTVGRVRTCGGTLGICTPGTETCGPTGWSACTGTTPRTESCNSLDDDCDGATDEGVTNACGGCGQAPLEVCDGADNDCDGNTDEGWLNRCGTCGPVPAEICDGADNDCDGSVDEGKHCGCVDGTRRVCPENPIGACTPGQQLCVAGIWQPCNGTGPQVEVCDDLDNNCNGFADEGLLNACQECGQTPAEVCDGIDNNCDGRVDEDLRNRCGTCGTLSQEDCNNIDDDCDGSVDEDAFCGCRDGQIEVCGVAPTGSVCTNGQRVCRDGIWLPCNGIGPQVEICDGLDNNCDGHADEDLLNNCGMCGAIPPEVCSNGLDDNCNGATDDWWICLFSFLP